MAPKLPTINAINTLINDLINKHSGTGEGLARQDHLQLLKHTMKEVEGLNNEVQLKLGLLFFISRMIKHFEYPKSSPEVIKDPIFGMKIYGSTLYTDIRIGLENFPSTIFDTRNVLIYLMHFNEYLSNKHLDNIVLKDPYCNSIPKLSHRLEEIMCAERLHPDNIQTYLSLLRRKPRPEVLISKFSNIMPWYLKFYDERSKVEKVMHTVERRKMIEVISIIDKRLSKDSSPILSRKDPRYTIRYALALFFISEITDTYFVQYDHFGKLHKVLSDTINLWHQARLPTNEKLRFFSNLSTYLTEESADGKLHDDWNSLQNAELYIVHMQKKIAARRENLLKGIADIEPTILTRLWAFTKWGAKGLLNIALGFGIFEAAAYGLKGPIVKITKGLGRYIGGLISEGTKDAGEWAGQKLGIFATENVVAKKATKGLATMLIADASNSSTEVSDIADVKLENSPYYFPKPEDEATFPYDTNEFVTALLKAPEKVVSEQDKIILSETCDVLPKDLKISKAENKNLDSKNIQLEPSLVINIDAKEIEGYICLQDEKNRQILINETGEYFIVNTQNRGNDPISPSPVIQEMHFEMVEPSAPPKSPSPKKPSTVPFFSPQPILVEPSAPDKSPTATPPAVVKI